MRTAVWTSAVAGRRKVMKLNVDGDGQGDLVGHGGVSRAVMVYQLDSYRYFGECSAGGIEGRPTTMLFDRDGILRQKVIGFEYTEVVEKDLKPLS